MEQMDKERWILLDFYEGSYGPTIRIDIKSMEGLLRIKAIFLELSQKVGLSLSLVNCKNIKSTGISSFVLMSIVKNQDAEKKLFLTIRGSSTADIQWKSSTENWERISCLVDALIESDEPGHQYLTEEGLDDALIELAYKE